MTAENIGQYELRTTLYWFSSGIIPYWRWVFKPQDYGITLFLFNLINL